MRRAWRPNPVAHRRIPVLFWQAFIAPPTEGLPRSIERAGCVELGVAGPEEGTTTLPTVEASAGATGFDLLAAQLTDGAIDVALNICARQGLSPTTFPG